MTKRRLENIVQGQHTSRDYIVLEQHLKVGFVLDSVQVSQTAAVVELVEDDNLHSVPSSFGQIMHSCRLMSRKANRGLLLQGLHPSITRCAR